MIDKYLPDERMKINVILAPCLLSENIKSDDNQLCVVIDVLRATTTITMAIANGAAEVYPCVDVPEARACLKSQSNKDCLLGGEARGEFIPGFDLGNSPFEYMDPNEISGKTVISTTSNGTPMIRKAYEITQQPVYLAALINLSAVSDTVAKKALHEQKESITVICSGRYDNASLEDILCAGLIANKVKEGLMAADKSPALSDGALMAGHFAEESRGMIFDLVSKSEAGRFLHDTGFAEDVRFCCRTDISRAIPIFVGDRIIPGNQA